MNTHNTCILSRRASIVNLIYSYFLFMTKLNRVELISYLSMTVYCCSGSLTERIIEFLQAEGYTIVPISRILLQGETYQDNTGRQWQK